ncbi:MAG: serine/threonine protein kinase [Myxococcaceae bacterium]
MLCYRCGSHNVDGSSQCAHCGQALAHGRAGAPLAEPTRQGVAEPPLGLGETFAGRYVLQEFLGAGPLGFVYRAEDNDLAAEVALKLIPAQVLRSAEERAAFLAQVKQARQFAHNQLARVYEEGEAEGWTYIVMPYLAGRSLRSVMLRKRGHFTLPDTVALLGQVANALAAAHIVGPHGDVKPENIFLLPDALKLTDFGVAAGMPRTTFVDLQRAAQGRAYLAPEVIAGEALDVRDDVYALGVLLGEVLAGALPGEGAPHLEGNFPRAVETLYQKSLSPLRSERPASAAEFAQALAKAAELRAPPPLPFDIMTAPPPPPPPSGTQTRRESGVIRPSRRRESDSGPTGTPPPPPVESVRGPSSNGGWDVSSAGRAPQGFATGTSRAVGTRRRAESMLSLAWIALAGLAVGALGGWWVLDRWLARLRIAPTTVSTDDSASGARPTAAWQSRTLAQGEVPQ